IVGVDLDPVGPPSDLVAHDATKRVAVGLLGALRDGELRRESRGTVAVRRDDGARGGQKARPLRDALPDGLLEADVRVAGALRPEVTHRRETRLKDAVQV